MSELRWNPFAALQQHRGEHHEDTEAQDLLADAIDHDDADTDIDQGKQTEEQPKPPDMNDLIRAAVGVRMPRDRHGRRVPEIGRD